MPQDLGELVELLELERLEVDLFRGQQPTTSLQRVFGGQVLAQALRAACYAAAEDRSVHSLHGYFLLGGDPSVPILYDVQRIRDGRSFSVLRVVARQHGRVIFYLTSSFHVRETGFEHQDVMPEVTAPEDCPSLAEVYSRAGDRSLEAWKSEWAALDVRYAGHSGPGGDLDGSTRPAKARLWLRAAGDLPDDPDLNACVLTYASDLTLLGASLVPHGVLIPPSRSARRPWTMRCGSTGRSEPTTGCSTTRLRPPPRVRAASPSAGCSTRTATSSCRSRRRA
jgi:acyl-CoA thioesterase-2